jgi:hypothetical protein
LHLLLALGRASARPSPCGPSLCRRPSKAKACGPPGGSLGTGESFRPGASDATSGNSHRLSFLSWDETGEVLNLLPDGEMKNLLTGWAETKALPAPSVDFHTLHERGLRYAEENKLLSAWGDAAKRLPEGSKSNPNCRPMASDLKRQWRRSRPSAVWLFQNRKRWRHSRGISDSSYFFPFGCSLVSRGGRLKAPVRIRAGENSLLSFSVFEASLVVGGSAIPKSVRHFL